MRGFQSSRKAAIYSGAVIAQGANPRVVIQGVGRCSQQRPAPLERWLLMEGSLLLALSALMEGAETVAEVVGFEPTEPGWLGPRSGSPECKSGALSRSATPP